MKKFYFICGVSSLLALLISGCGPRYYIAGDANKPGEVVASGYTQDGCLEELREESKTQNVEVKLKKIDTDLGWAIFLFPFYKGYRCFGEVVGPAKKLDF